MWNETGRSGKPKSVSRGPLGLRKCSLKCNVSITCMLTILQRQLPNICSAVLTSDVELKHRFSSFQSFHSTVTLRKTWNFRVTCSTTEWIKLIKRESAASWCAILVIANAHGPLYLHKSLHKLYAEIYDKQKDAQIMLCIHKSTIATPLLSIPHKTQGTQCSAEAQQHAGL